MPNRQRNAYDSNFKLEVLSFAEKHTNAETMQYFGINEKLVRDWKKAKTKLEALEKPVKKIRFNSSPIEDIEKELIAWVTNSIDQGYIVNHTSQSSRIRHKRQFSSLTGLQSICWMVYEVYETPWSMLSHHKEGVSISALTVDFSPLLLTCCHSFLFLVLKVIDNYNKHKL